MDLFTRGSSAPEPGFFPAPAGTERQNVSIGCQWNGRSFAISLDSAELEAEVVPRVSAIRELHAKPDFTFSLSTVEDLIYLHCGAEFMSAETSVSAARAILLQEIVRRVTAVDNAPRQWLGLLHAGACGNRRRCVVFPAASHSGKTTLAAVLMQRGLTFYADDSVALEKETLEIPAMPFGLPIRQGSWPLLADLYPGFCHLPLYERFGQPVRYLYPPVHQTSVPAAAIVFPRYVQGAELSIHPLNTLEALIRMKEGGFWVENEHASIRAFLDWIESLPCYQMTYSDVHAASRFIANLLPE